MYMDENNSLMHVRLWEKSIWVFKNFNGFKRSEILGWFFITQNMKEIFFQNRIYLTVFFIKYLEKLAWSYVRIFILQNITSGLKIVGRVAEVFVSLVMHTWVSFLGRYGQTASCGPVNDVDGCRWRRRGGEISICRFSKLKRFLPFLLNFGTEAFPNYHLSLKRLLLFQVLIKNCSFKKLKTRWNYLIYKKLCCLLDAHVKFSFRC